MVPLTAESMHYGIGSGVRAQVSTAFSGGVHSFVPFVHPGGVTGPAHSAVSGARITEPGKDTLFGSWTVVGTVGIAPTVEGFAKTGVGFGVQALDGPSPVRVNAHTAQWIGGHYIETDTGRYLRAYSTGTGAMNQWDVDLVVHEDTQLTDRRQRATFALHRLPLPEGAAPNSAQVVLYEVVEGDRLREMGRLTNLPNDQAFRTVVRGHTGRPLNGAPHVMLYNCSLSYYDVSPDGTRLVPSQRIRVAGIGDSVMANSGVMPSERPDNLLREVGGRGVEFLNFGRGGARIYDGDHAGTGIMESGIVAKAAAAKPDIWVVSVGNNDLDSGNLVGTEAERKAKLYQHYIDLLAEIRQYSPFAPIIICQPPAVADRPNGDPEGSVGSGRRKLLPNLHLSNALRAGGFIISRRYDVMRPHIGEPGFFMQGDFVHPGALGCFYMAQADTAALEQALTQLLWSAGAVN